MLGCSQLETISSGENENNTIPLSTFSDAVFREYVAGNFDTNLDGELTDEEISHIMNKILKSLSYKFGAVIR